MHCAANAIRLQPKCAKPEAVMGYRNYERICSFGKKGVSYYLNIDTTERKYYIFKTSEYGKKMDGRVNIPAAVAKKIAEMDPADGLKASRKAFSSVDDKKVYRAKNEAI